MPEQNTVDSNGTDLRYPIGKFQLPPEITPAQRVEWRRELQMFPGQLRAATADLSTSQLDTPYRLGGWTVRQVVHHLPDSHMNSYVRFRLALTEETPSIRPYHEGRWAELADARTGPIAPSLMLLEALHLRWVSLLESLRDEQFERSFYHPELREVKLERALGLYAWHGRHHLAQVTGLRSRMNW